MTAKVCVEEEFIFLQGDIPDLLYMIVSGTVNVYIDTNPLDVLNNGIVKMMKFANRKIDA